MASDRPLQSRLFLPVIASKAGLPVRKSAVERQMGREISYWTRGMHFTWIWEDLGIPWHWYEQTWIFRGTRKWYLLFVPMFWRSLDEFYQFEDRFIHEATNPRAVMSEQEFIQRSKRFKAELNLSILQSFFAPVAAARYGGIVAKAVNVMDKVDKVQFYQKAYHCSQGDDKACHEVVYSWALGKAQKRMGME